MPVSREKRNPEKSHAPDGVKVVIVHVVGEVVDEEFFALVLRVLGDDGAVEVQNEHLHLAGLPRLPQVARDVEQERLRTRIHSLLRGRYRQYPRGPYLTWKKRTKQTHW